MFKNIQTQKIYKNISKLVWPTCVYKQYEVKIKKVPEQWLQLKMKFLLGYNMKIFI